jgi:hypothetical protein
MISGPLMTRPKPVLVYSAICVLHHPPSSLAFVLYICVVNMIIVNGIGIPPGIRARTRTLTHIVPIPVWTGTGTQQVPQIVGIPTGIFTIQTVSIVFSFNHGY